MLSFVLKVYSQLVLAPGLWVAHDVPRCSKDFKRLAGSRVLVLVWMDLNLRQQLEEISTDTSFMYLYSVFITKPHPLI